MRRFLLIPHLKIHNANAMSSPYTIGFPAMTAWLGAVHALQRYIHQQSLPDVSFYKVAISSHKFDLQTYKGHGDFVNSIIATANPLDKDGTRSAFIEEARCHVEVSILIEYAGLDPDDEEHYKNSINNHIHCMKWASGDVMSCKPIELLNVDEEDESSVKALLVKLMLGYVLIERRDLMLTAMQENPDALDALLSYLKVMYRSESVDDKVLWKATRKQAGWLVPIAVGFQGISALGIAQHQRDIDTPHRFAESVVTLGEFVMPYRIKNIDDMLWQYHVDLQKNLYVCQTTQPKN